jgi:hypothetical protein
MRMGKAEISACVLFIMAAEASLVLAREQSQPVRYAGSVSCRECHERFYQLWSASRHGLAMQPYKVEFSRKELTAQAGEIRIGKSSYHADISGSSGFVRERGTGSSSKSYRIDHVL